MLGKDNRSSIVLGVRTHPRVKTFSNDVLPHAPSPLFGEKRVSSFEHRTRRVGKLTARRACAAPSSNPRDHKALLRVDGRAARIRLFPARVSGCRLNNDNANSDLLASRLCLVLSAMRCVLRVVTGRSVEEVAVVGSKSITDYGLRRTTNRLWGYRYVGRRCERWRRARGARSSRCSAWGTAAHVRCGTRRSRRLQNQAIQPDLKSECENCYHEYAQRRQKGRNERQTRRERQPDLERKLSRR